ncbi:MAG: hypothetical protein ACI9X0_002899, partial [Kiritimatiellia bacterium]
MRTSFCPYRDVARRHFGDVCQYVAVGMLAFDCALCFRSRHDGAQTVCSSSYFLRKTMRLTRIILGIGLFAVLGCGDRSEPVTLEPARQEANTAGEPTARSSRERFGYTAAPAEGAGTLKAPFAGSGASPADPSSLHWSVPAGWTQGPARRMREVTFFLD